MTRDSEPGNDTFFPSLQINIEYIRTRYNLLINSDIILREFTMNAHGKQYDAFLIYIDGMVDSKIMDDFILKPYTNNLVNYEHTDLYIIQKLIIIEIVGFLYEQSA